MRHFFRCYAEGSDRDGWEAFCIDLDIAVQADTLDEAARSLHEAIHLYLKTVVALPPQEAAALLNRPTPIGLQLKFVWALIRGMFSRGDSDNQRHTHGFTCPAPA